MAKFAQRSVLLAFLPAAFGRVGYDLRPTQTNYAADQYDFQWGWTPVPTSGPHAFGGLERRQGIAPNSTCGFISGLSTSVLTCNNGLDCGFNSGYGAAGCCTGYTLENNVYTLTGCDFFTACLDSTAAAASCDSSCQSNTHELKCEQAALPYCITWSFTDIGYTNLGCAAESGLTGYLAVTYDAPPVSSTTTTTTTTVVIVPGSSTTTQTPPPTTLTTTTSSSVQPQVFTTPSTSSVPGTSSATPSTTPPSSSIVPLVTSSSGSGTSPTAPSSIPSSIAPTVSSSSSSGFGMSASSSTVPAIVPVATTLSISSDTLPIDSTTAGVVETSTTTVSSATGSAAPPGIVSTNSESTGSTATATETSTDTSTAPSSSSSGSSSAQNSSSSHSSSNTGAIAGGVVGGLGGLAVIAGLIWFFMRRKKSSPTSPTPDVSQASPTHYPYSPVSPNTPGPSHFGSPQQVHEFPATAAAAAAPVAGAAYAYNRPQDHPQSSYQPPSAHPPYAAGAANPNAYEISSEGTGSSRPLSPSVPYSNAPEVVQQGGYRGVDPTNGGYGSYSSYGNPYGGHGQDPGFYGRPYSEMP